MRIAILADIHGNVLALEAVLASSTEVWSSLSTSVTVCLVRCGRAKPPNCSDSSTGQLFVATMTCWVTDWPPEKHYREDAFAFQSLGISELAWLRALPSTRELSDGVFACHGRPDNDNAYLLENVEGGRLVPARRTEVAERVRAVASRFVLCAHSSTTGDKMIINPGSVGLPARSARSSLAARLDGPRTTRSPCSTPPASRCRTDLFSVRMTDGRWYAELPATRMLLAWQQNDACLGQGSRRAIRYSAERAHFPPVLLAASSLC
jgi:hypothetical protein